MPCNTTQHNAPRTFSRRRLLKNTSAGLCAASVNALLPEKRHTAYAATTGAQCLVVAGMADSICGQWADLLAPSLAERLRLPAFKLKNTLGWDGITAANLFEVQQMQIQPPAGLVVPGTVILAELGGDSRVHYDYQRWIPTFLSYQPTVTVGRISLHRSFSAILKEHPLRVAVSGYAGRELPSLLALELLKLHPLPLTGFGTPESAIEALLSGAVDIIQLPVDSAYAERIASLKEKGFRPLFTNCLYKNNLPDTELPPVFGSICMQERPRAFTSPLYKVWSTATTASTLCAGLMMPFLSAPETVAHWRQACQELAALPDIRNHARAENEVIKTGADCMALYAATKADTLTTITLRRWLALNIPRWRDAQAGNKPALNTTTSQ